MSTLSTGFSGPCTASPASGSPLAPAARAGFADQAHLSRWFSRCYGITPGRCQHAAPA